MKSTVNVICYKSKVLANGEHPLMIRICKDNKKKYQSLGISVSPKHWDFKKNKPKPNCPNKELILKIILEKETEFQKQILELNSERKDYTATTLLTSVSDKIELKTVEEFYKELIAKFRSLGKQGNYLVYKDSYNSIRSFTKGKIDIPFSDIDVKWLNEYEAWLRTKKNAETSISLSFRTLRSAYNKAIEAKHVRRNLYPFHEFKISKFDTKTNKRAISKELIIKIIELDISKKRYYLQFAKDIFIFSYLCGGINFSDISHLTMSNIIGNNMSYKRKKTGKQITIPLIEPAIKIVDKYSVNVNTTGYIFPILDKNTHLTEIQKYNRIHKVMGKVNKALKDISKLIGEDVNLTTYVARHSYATVLKNSGVNIALIGETLGHSDLKTTQIYLDSFENNQIDEALVNLL
ncbi:site-specific integrase [Dysgonomonas sp. 216]|uniref:site-specific integrase n=1 Tax=Dysgonomonas sp. 216 TaxID=2302934 RepID=UPI0013D4E910|nr:site-specific integrase [Dysgonomonas sp. 216]NDW19866.1 site-specific integrase [Dysgonomonas sp. 216]